MKMLLELINVFNKIITREVLMGVYIDKGTVSKICK